MQIAEFDILPSLVGGILIGLAAVLVLLLNGKIAGISGIVGRLFARVPGDTAWRAIFLVGLIVAGAILFRVSPRAAEYKSTASVPTLIVAGLLVGIGTRVGGGCTSGHGVCGIARLSRRSMVATLIFMGAAALTVFVTRHLIGEGPA